MRTSEEFKWLKELHQWGKSLEKRILYTAEGAARGHTTSERKNAPHAAMEKAPD